MAAFAYWGYRRGNGAVPRTLLAVVAPAVAFGVWGAVDFRQLGRFAEPARPVEELTISGLAVAALCAARQPSLAVVLGAVCDTPRVGLRHRRTPAEGVAGLVNMRRHTDGTSSVRTPVVVGGVFGFVYVMANVTACRRRPQKRCA